MTNEIKYPCLYKRINKISSSEENLLKVITEIVRIRGYKYDNWDYIVHFLKASLYPFPSHKKKLIKKYEVSHSDLLWMRVKDFNNEQYKDIYPLCVELIKISKSLIIEECTGTKLYVLINKAINSFSKKR